MDLVSCWGITAGVPNMNSSHYTKTRRLIPETPDDRYAGHLIHPAKPTTVTEGQCIGRENELDLVRIALGLDENWKGSKDRGLYRAGCQRMRLEGPSGRGKRSIVLEVARRTALPLYEMHGHAGMSSEDLVLAIVPRASDDGHEGSHLVIQASPLATALLWGGILYFDAIHRAPVRALTPLASLLGGRMTLYSGLTGLQLTARPDAAPFIFFCSLDSSESYNLPGFIEQRTLPILELEPLRKDNYDNLLGKLSSTHK